jgi:enoyl-CoA hydratase/carnithine racemase
MNELSLTPGLLIEQKSRTISITLNRPDRGNSLDPPTIVALHEAVSAAQKQDKIQLIILSGAGYKDFCTGIDVAAGALLSSEQRLNIANVAGDIATMIYYGKPTLVAMNGRSMGMGVVFATAADYRIIRQDSVLKMPEINAGIFPGASCIALMSRVCGIAWTRRILMTGEDFTCEDALTAGIVDEIVAEDAFQSRKDEVKSELVRKNSILLKAIKFAAVRGLDIPYREMVGLEQQLAEYYKWSKVPDALNNLPYANSWEKLLTGNPNALLEEYKNAVAKQNPM